MKKLFLAVTFIIGIFLITNTVETTADEGGDANTESQDLHGEIMDLKRQLREAHEAGDKDSAAELFQEIRELR